MADTTPASGHPLSKAQHQSAFTIAALFWGVGVAMIDPRTGVGILLCVIGIAATLWLYWSDLLGMRSRAWRVWPWLGLFFIVIEILVPCWLLASKSWGATEQTVAVLRPPLPANVPDHPPSTVPTKRRLVSNFKRLILICESPEPAAPRSLEQRKADWALMIELMQRIYGYSAKGTAEEDELTLSVAAKMGVGNVEENYLIKRTGDNVFVSVTRDFESLSLRLFMTLESLTRFDPEEDSAKRIKQRVEELVGVEPGKCSYN